MLFAAIGFASIQFIPVEHRNPPKTYEPAWDSPETKAFARRACYDCHSNETNWPWYSYVAPISWRISGHVNEGRRKFNISEGRLDEAHEAAEEVLEGKMPLRDYLLLHPEARLSNTEKQRFIAGLQATFGGDRNRERGQDDESHESEKHE